MHRKNFKYNRGHSRIPNRHMRMHCRDPIP
ncbi:MAG: hypothetical protein ACTIDA_03235 [Pseudolactococcus laudensis]